ncbi:NADP-specific glutamate dehydrogenase [Bifidobacterium longum subsp. longum]|nr:NADP-specific glutamate dehydrogenase [Bifidobacterium longum subsp. longum]
MLTDEYIKRVYDQVVARDGDQPEFLQAVREVFETLQPVGRPVYWSASSSRSAPSSSAWPGLTTRARFR